MIIDARGNLVAPPETYFMKAQTVVDRGWGLGVAPPSQERIEEYAARSVAYLEEVGTDLQLVTPRVYHLAHSESPPSVPHRWVPMYNDVLASIVDSRPERLRGIGGLPQVPGESTRALLGELERCVELGFVGVVLNPDPGEGGEATPNLADEHWFPLYERLEQLDMPAIVASGACRDTREGYHGHHITEASIAALALIEHPEVFETFPRLKIVISYGGGSLPYQAGRWQVRRWRQPHLEPFETSLRRLWFDTVVYSTRAIELLLEVCGVDRCLFASQRPGPGTGRDPETGRSGDDVKRLVDEIDWLTPADRRAIFEDNARRVFTRLGVASDPSPPGAPT